MDLVRRDVRFCLDKHVAQPTMTRLEAISALADAVGEEDILVSNIGVPSKELFASLDRPLNFYMLGSYTQATPIALGMDLSSDRRVFVVDGSLLRLSIFPVLAAEKPVNLTILCVDNGIFGSTGNQINRPTILWTSVPLPSHSDSMWRLSMIPRVSDVLYPSVMG